MEGEAIMICIDTSGWMNSIESPRFKDQADAIELYCTEKFKSHPETVVGICGMGVGCITNLCRPTRAIPRVMRAVYEATIGGHDFLLIEAVMDAYDVWFGCRGKEHGKHLPKRIVVFAGGPLYEEMGDVQILGEAMKDKNVACDAISFGYPKEFEYKKELFENLIAAADNNGNCNLLIVPPESSVLDALSRSQIIRSGSAPFASLSEQPESSKQNIMDAALYSVADNTEALALSSSQIIPHVGGSGPLASLWVQQESSKLDKKAAANYPESVDPHDHPDKINALSQSVVDLKLENVKTNSQPETLDQRIERAKRELQSLLMQKKKQKNKQKKNKQKKKQVDC